MTRNNWREFSDEEFETIITTALKIQGRIIQSGSMATKSKVEDELVTMFDVTRSLAHDAMNHIQTLNLKPIYPVV